MARTIKEGKELVPTLSDNTKTKLKKYNKERKVIRWMWWAMRVLQRKNKTSFITDNCAYGNKHLVIEVVKVGNGAAFRSAACAGCAGGKLLIKGIEEGTLEYNKESPVDCAILQECWLISNKPVRPGEIVKLPVVRELDKDRRIDNVVSAFMNTTSGTSTNIYGV
jgi:hypothetical protein